MGNDVTRSPWGHREALKEIAISQDHNHLNSVEEVIGSEGEKLDLDCAECGA
jgi:hypothetical protein